MKKSKTNKGITILESLVCIVIVGIGFVAMLQISAYSISSMDRAIENNKVNFLTEMMAEDMIADPDQINQYASFDEKCNYNTTNGTNIYEKQKEWIVGDTIDEINNNLKKIATTSGINSDKIENCFSDETIENKVLNGRIEGDKKYSISSTPTIIINEKKFIGSNDFNNIEKAIKKGI